MTNKLYQLTLLFPKKEPLRYKMRELAGDILANLTRSKNHQHQVLVNLGELEALDSFFEVAKSQNWVRTVDILNLQQEYSKLRNEFEPLSEAQPQKSENSEINSQEEAAEFVIPERHAKILEILKERGKAQVWEIKQIFPEVTKRTLRRDFDFLLRQGRIERIGERNTTSYRLIG